MKKLIGITTLFLTSAVVSSNCIHAEDVYRDDIRVDIKILTLMKINRIPSVVTCIVKDEKVVWSNGYGFSDYLKLNRASTDDIYMVASLSKVVVAIAILQLHEKGLVNIDDDINEYLPFNIRNPKYPDTPITLRMLLAHQSSLYESAIVEYKSLPLMVIKSLPYLNDTSRFLMESLTPGGELYNPNIWQGYQPGSKANYSNMGFILLGYIVERLTNQSLDDYCRENIFKPLKMYNSSFSISRLDGKRLARHYTRMGFLRIPLPKCQLPLSIAAAGGLRTTTADFSHLLIALNNGGVYEGRKILNESSVELMRNVAYPNSSWHNIKFGLGWIFWEKNGVEWEGHTGGGPGVYAVIAVSRVYNIGIIYFMNYLKPFLSSPFDIWVRSKIFDILFEKAVEL